MERIKMSGQLNSLIAFAEDGHRFRWDRYDEALEASGCDPWACNGCGATKTGMWVELEQPGRCYCHDCAEVTPNA